MRRAILLILIAAITCLGVGCSKPPERTQDPAEIEKLRIKHKSMAEREFKDG